MTTQPIPDDDSERTERDRLIHLLSEALDALTLVRDQRDEARSERDEALDEVQRLLEELDGRVPPEQD